jgi:hypothetical protein
MELLCVTNLQMGVEDTKGETRRIEAKKDVESAVHDVMMAKIENPT